MFVFDSNDDSEVTGKLDVTSARLRASGVKVTRYRIRVLELLSNAGRPLSHGDIAIALSQASGPYMDRVTLYRVLDSLVGKGLVLKAVDANGVFRYSGAQARRPHAGHVHFHCLDCGGMFCLEAKPPTPPRLPSGFRLREVEYDVRGSCPDCSEAVSAAVA
jgi:Fur family ferric uptake transcriptional regulator